MKNSQVCPAPEASKEVEGMDRDLPPAARRALAEAAARRNNESVNRDEKREIHGRQGPDPVRFGDWEKDGIISDF